MAKRDNHVGRMMRIYRNIKGLTLKDMGNELGITYQQYQRYEKGITPPPFDRLEKIINILGIPPAKLFNNKKIIDSKEDFEKKLKKYGKILMMIENDPKLLKVISLYSSKSHEKNI